MVKLVSGMTWFEDEEWIGTKVSFDQPQPCTWILVEKIREREKYEPEQEWIDVKLPSEARGIFLCEKEGEPHRQTVLKIYMQIPFYGTISKPRHIRAKQARIEMDDSAKDEILALQGLTDAGCSSTPSLIAWKNEPQNEDRYVPGGYITYILMEKAPGIPLELFSHLPREERDQARAAFKKAWEECVKAGFVHWDKASRNIIWDKEEQKCYLVDWEIWAKPRPKDTLYIGWLLARRGHDGDLDDMSTWEWM